MTTYALVLCGDVESIKKFLEELQERHPYTMLFNQYLCGTFYSRIESETKVNWEEVLSICSQVTDCIQAGLCETVH